MKKIITISFLLIVCRAYCQIDWRNYSTSFVKNQDIPSLGVAVPYNGIYDNFERDVVGKSHWNPQYNLNIDTSLNEKIPLLFVYDTSGIFFLAPQLNEKNTNDYKFTVLLNNKTMITPWSHINQFTTNSVGTMEAGSGITGNYHAAIGHYLVAHLRDNRGHIISSIVIYFKKYAPEIKSVSTSDNSSVFSNLLSDKNYFTASQPDIGWHRQYTTNLTTQTDELKLAYNENNLLIGINSNIFKKEALEYALFKGDKEVRNWNGNEYNNHQILLKNLEPGTYRILIRFKRQPNSVSELRFSISSVWYKTASVKAAILILLILTASFIFFFLKYRNQKKALKISNQKAEQTIEELKNIHTLLNPHFTFNALNSIQGLVNKGDVDAASKYLSSFGELLRETLKQSKTDLLPLTKEIENLKTYLGLEQLRYPFTYNLSIDENLDLGSSTIPPFLLQPFVENAIKHAFSKMNGQGTLNIYVQKTGDTMTIKIRDNGPGFELTHIQEGYGLALSRKRIALLNREYGDELINMQIESSGKGTQISLSFKNWL